jgi:hypothetical protein
MELYLHSPIRLHGIVFIKKQRDNFISTVFRLTSVNTYISIFNSQLVAIFQMGKKDKTCTAIILTVGMKNETNCKL